MNPVPQLAQQWGLAGGAATRPGSRDGHCSHSQTASSPAAGLWVAHGTPGTRPLLRLQSAPPAPPPLLAGRGPKSLADAPGTVGRGKRPPADLRPSRPTEILLAAAA